MPSATYTPLFSTTLAASASSVVIPNIPQTYRDLVLVVNVDGTSQTELYLRFNGDTGGNYNTVRMQGSGSTAASGLTTNATGMRLNGNGDIMTDFSFSAVIQIEDYSATDKHKAVLSRTNSSNGVDACAGRWANTAAITTVLAYPAAGSFDVGTTLALYGIAS